MKMSNIINDPVLVSAIQDLARGIKSEAELSSLTRELLKITVEASLNAEMEAHLGYPNHSPRGIIPVTAGMAMAANHLKAITACLRLKRHETATAPLILSLCVKIKRG
jgi:hypothetical protein